MPAPITRAAVVAKIRRELTDGCPNPKVSLAEVAVLLRFHYRTIRRYDAEGVIRAESVAPGAKRYVRLSELRQKFPEDIRDIPAHP